MAIAQPKAAGAKWLPMCVANRYVTQVMCDIKTYQIDGGQGFHLWKPKSLR